MNNQSSSQTHSTPLPRREGQGSGSLKSTIAVSLTNYLDAGAIVAGASGLTLWKNYLEQTSMVVSLSLPTTCWSI